jgi:hypothetical protein
LERDVPTLALYRSKESWNRYHPEEFWNALHVINGESAGNYHLMDEESNGIGDSAGNYQVIHEESTRGRGFHRELLAYLRGFRPVRSKCAENPSNGNNSRIRSFKSYILTIPTFFKN